MAVTWSKSPDHTWPDNNVTINTSQSTDDKCVVDVPQGAACGQYWVLYKNIDNGTTCTGETYFTVTGDCGGGGETCTLKITEANNTKTVSKDGNVDLQFSHSDIPIDCTIEGKSFAASDGGSTTTIGKVPGNTTGWVFEVVSDSNHMLNDTPIQASPSRDIVAFLNKNDSEGSVMRSARIKATCSGDNCRGCTEIIFEISQLGTSGPDNNHIRFLIRNLSTNGHNGTTYYEKASVWYDGDIVIYYSDDGEFKDGPLGPQTTADAIQLYLVNKEKKTGCDTARLWNNMELKYGETKQVDVEITSSGGDNKIPASAIGQKFMNKIGTPYYINGLYLSGNPSIKFGSIKKTAAKLVEDNGDTRYGDASRCQRCVDYDRGYTYTNPVKDANGGGNTILRGHTYYIDIFGTTTDKESYINSTDGSYTISNASHNAYDSVPPTCTYSDGTCRKPGKNDSGNWTKSVPC